VTSPDWYYKEAIEHELERLAAVTWRLQADQARFRDEALAAAGEVELSSDVYGALLLTPADVLRRLSQLQDGVGDERISHALFGNDPAAPR
jgi:hypothetical protein